MSAHATTWQDIVDVAVDTSAITLHPKAQVAEPRAVDNAERDNLIETIMGEVGCIRFDAGKAVRKSLKELNHDIDLLRQAVDAVRRQSGIMLIVRDSGDPYVLLRKAVLKARQMRASADKPRRGSVSATLQELRAAGIRLDSDADPDD